MKRFQCCLNPNISRHILYYRAIQGHSGGDLVDPELHDNVLLSEDFTEYICHIGNLSGMHSSEVDCSQKEEVSKWTDNLCFSLQ